MNFPFKETSIGDNQYIREFSVDVYTDELEWHLDKEDRIVEVIEDGGWQFQLDNKLPIPLIGKVYVPKETYHRVLKGNSKLIIQITKL
jgi:hypothetical protein